MALVPVKGNPFASAQLQQRAQAIAAQPMVDPTGVGDVVMSVSGLLGQAFPGLKPYLPNADTAHQFVRQATGDISDAAQAAAAAGGQAVHNLAAGDWSTKPGDMYNAVRQAQRDRTARYDSPANTAAGVVGGLSTLALGGAGAAPRIAKGAQAVAELSRGARLAAAAPKLAKAGGLGAGIGAAVGAASAPTWQAAPGAAVTGAEIGGAAAPAGAVIGAAGRTPFVQGVARRVGAAGSAIGEGVSRAFVAPPAAATESAVTSATPDAAEVIRAMMDRAGVTLEDLQNHPGVARDITAAEVIGPEAINRVTALSRRPGATANVAQPLLEGRSSNALQRFAGDVHAATNISPEDARDAVDAIVAKGQAEAKPLFEKALGAPGPVWNVDLANLANRPVIKDAIGAAVNSLKNAGLEPLAPGIAIDPDTGAAVSGEDLKSLIELQPTARAWDLVRRKAQSLVQLDQTGRPITTGKLGIYNSNLAQAGSDLSAALREAIPGYADALDHSAQYLKVRDAYERSAHMLNQGTTVKDVANYVSGLSEPERQAVQHSFARQLYDMIDKGTMRPSLFEGYGQGVRENIAGKLATVFSPDAAEKLSTAATAERKLQGAAARMAPLANSTTGAALEADDPNSVAGQNIARELAQGRIKGAGLMAVFGPAGRAAAAPGTIALRDAQGRLLLMSPPRLAEELSKLPARRPIVSIDAAAAAAPTRAGLLSRQNDQQ